MKSREFKTEMGTSVSFVETQLCMMELLMEYSLKRIDGWRRSHKDFHNRGMDRVLSGCMAFVW